MVSMTFVAALLVGVVVAGMILTLGMPATDRNSWVNDDEYDHSDGGIFDLSSWTSDDYSDSSND